MSTGRSEYKSTSLPLRARFAIQVLAVLLGMFTAVSSTWAVFARQDGNTLKLKNEMYQPLGNATATISLGGEKQTVQTDEKGTICIKNNQNATEEDRKNPYCVIFSGHGEGQISVDGVSMPFTLSEQGDLSIPLQHRVSNTEIGAAVVGAGAAVYAITKDDNDGTATNGGGTGTAPPPAAPPPSMPPGTGLMLNNCPGQFSANFNLTQSTGGCPPVAQGPRTCTLSTISGTMKHFTCGANTGDVTGNLDLNTGAYNGVGSGSYSAASNAPFNYTLIFTIQGNACTFSGTMQAGPPLLGPTESCRYQVSGSGNRVASGP